MVVFLFTGKTYALVYKSVHVEDAAEIKFVAEKAESRAQLRVKGKSNSNDSIVKTVFCNKLTSSH